MNFLGMNWVGITPENGRKLLLSVVFVTVVLLGSRGLRALVGLVLRRTDAAGIQTRFGPGRALACWRRWSSSLACCPSGSTTRPAWPPHSG